MSEVLVLVDHVDGAVRKPTYELLTIAKRLGEPSAVFIGEPGKAADVAEKVKAYGAEKVYVVDDAQIKGYLVAPKAEALQQIAEKVSPAAILIPSSAEGKEIGARLAIKLESGLITDAVDVQEGGVATQSVFAGNYTLTGRSPRGRPSSRSSPTPPRRRSPPAPARWRSSPRPSATPRRRPRSWPRSRARRPVAPSSPRPRSSSPV